MAFWNALFGRRAARGARLRGGSLLQRSHRGPVRVGRLASGCLLVTRFGLHTAEVMVGHFGARSRFNYTALGDGVNLAARLEPLCKQYGVTALVSEVIANAARDKFVFPAGRPRRRQR